MTKESIYRGCPSPVKGGGEYFEILVKLDDLKQEKKLAERQGRGPYEQDKLLKAIEKSEQKVQRVDEFLNPTKQNRARGQAMTTHCVAAYLKLYPDGSATVQKENCPSLFSWANKNIENPFNNFEIEKVNSTESITLIDRAGNKTTFTLARIRNEISKQKKS